MIVPASIFTAPTTLILRFILGLLLIAICGRSWAFELTAQEQAWLREHPHITFAGDPDWLPFEEFDDNGQYHGIVAQYLAMIEQAIGAEMQKIRTENWSETMERVQAGEVDVLSDAAGNEAVYNTHQFTKAYFSTPLVVLSRQPGPALQSLNSLPASAKVAMIRSYGYIWDVYRLYPDREFAIVDSINAGLDALSRNELDYFILTQTAAQFWLERLKLDSITIRGQLPIQMDLAFAIRSDWPQLLSIINRLLDDMTPAQRYAVLQNWYITNNNLLQNKTWWQKAVTALVLLFALTALGYAIKRHQHNVVAEQHRRQTQALLAVDTGEWEWEPNKQRFYIAQEFLQHRRLHQPVQTLDDLAQLVDERDLNHVLQTLQQFSSQREQKELTLSFRVGQPTPRWMRLQGRVTRREKGKPTRVLGTIQDVTENQDLIRDLEQFQRFAQYSAQGMGMSTVSGRAIYFNPSLSQMLLGVSHIENYEELNYVQFYPPEILEKLKTTVMPEVMTNGFWQGELALITKTGKAVPTYETIFLIRDNHGEPAFLGDVIMDISERKAAEAAVNAAREQADRANASKSAFLANMSHEIRTPLNAVIGYSQLLEQNDDLPAQAKTQVNRIHRAGERLLALINDVLDISKMEAGKLTLNQEVFALKRELQDLAAMAKIKANNKGLKLRLDLALEPDDLVEADKGKFGQIITNLLGNAVKFTDSGVITLQAKREHDDIEIAVEDHGPGISAEDQAQLFSVFNQGRAGEIHGGTGLGLTLSRRLAEMMGGSISLHSSLGQGTRVVLTAPWPRQTIKNLPTQPTLEQTRIDGHGLTVLVVEDDAMSIDILANYLRALNFTVLTATSGESGWQLAQQQTQLSAIFTDIRMAEMSGLGLLDLCKDHPILSKVPTIAVSASSLEHERQHFLEHGFDDFVAKPIDFTLLDGVIAQHVMGAVVALADQNPTLATHPTNPEEIKELNSEELLAACDAILIAAANGDVQQARMDADKSRQQHWLDQATQNQLDDALARYDLAAVEALIKAIKAEVAQLES